jgi:hypothetical protein
VEKRETLDHRTRLSAPAAILAFAVALVLPGEPSGADRKAGDLELLILSTASNRGEVEPCG